MFARPFARARRQGGRTDKEDPPIAAPPLFIHVFFISHLMYVPVHLLTATRLYSCSCTV